LLHDCAGEDSRGFTPTFPLVWREMLVWRFQLQAHKEALGRCCHWLRGSTAAAPDCAIGPRVVPHLVIHSTTPDAISPWRPDSTSRVGTIDAHSREWGGHDTRKRTLSASSSASSSRSREAEDGASGREAPLSCPSILARPNGDCGSGAKRDAGRCERVNGEEKWMFRVFRALWR